MGFEDSILHSGVTSREQHHSLHRDRKGPIRVGEDPVEQTPPSYRRDPRRQSGVSSGMAALENSSPLRLVAAHHMS